MAKRRRLHISTKLTSTPAVRVVFGAERAAIYDFSSGNVYSVNMAGRQAIEKINNNEALNENERSFLKNLKNKGLSRFSLDEKTHTVSLAIPLLEFICVEVTQMCNLRCKHCYGGFPLRESLISSDTQRRVIEEARQLGATRIQFSGGEPLVDFERLLFLVNVAQHAGFDEIEVFSNGTLLNKTIVQELAKRNVSFRVSLYAATPEIHDSITRTKGSYEKTVQGLRLLLSQNIKTAVAMVVMRENEREVKRAHQILKQLGVEEFGIDVVRPVGRGKDPDIFPRAPEYARYWVKDKPNFKTSEDSFMRFKRGNICWQGCVVISPSGEVLPCVFARNLDVCNIANKPLKEAIDVSLSKYWHLSNGKLTPCKNCEFRYCCSVCLAVALSEDKDNRNINRPYKQCMYNPYKGKRNSC